MANSNQKFEQICRFLKVGGVLKFGALTLACDRVYSYDTVIAAVDRRAAEKGKLVLFLNTKKYSQTTSTHQNLLRRAADRNPEFSIVEKPEGFPECFR